jgi:hypothetical protein
MCSGNFRFNLFGVLFVSWAIWSVSSGSCSGIGIMNLVDDVRWAIWPVSSGSCFGIGIMNLVDNVLGPAASKVLCCVVVRAHDV